jgi:Domain of unknown function (DUF4349)
MNTLVEAVRNIKAPRLYFLAAFGMLLLLAAITLSRLGQSHRTDELSKAMPQQTTVDNEAAGRAYAPALLKPKLSAFVQTAGIADSQVIAPNAGQDAGAGRRIVRSASIEMVVQHPAEVADRIMVLAEKLGGYLVSADGGGQGATATTLTIRVPVPHFGEARAEIRELGLRVENEKFDAQDVTQQYVDQDASIRNLQAEELQYLEILKRANDINSMMLVAQRLSQVRGEIEKKQAEFNSLAHQTETVAIAISVRTEKEQQVFGLDWRPLYELKVAASDGLASLATYATSMMTILFFLPAALLWAGTFFITAVLGWRGVRWVRQLWLGWTAAQDPVQG